MLPKPPSKAPEMISAFLEAQRLRQAVDDLKRFNEQSLLYPDSLRIRKKVLAMVGERDLSTRHDSLRVSERC